MPLPSFLPVSYHERRALWCRYRARDPDVQRLVLEVQRFRGVVDEAYQRQQVIEKCWREEGHGQLVALEKLRLLLNNERTR
ncbi:hypothetical protein AWB77_06298 [Caballeronia fortuita]|uniref:Uncharacterized protein n=1 Tax=Caballeronia fortuita TaxID=1777138 RepID=A0A158E2Z8_9BURK|nr:hypothetical protein AWB77_06298 [Caballeronia fortuita]